MNEENEKIERLRRVKAYKSLSTMVFFETSV